MDAFALSKNLLPRLRRLARSYREYSVSRAQSNLLAAGDTHITSSSNRLRVSSILAASLHVFFLAGF